MKRYVTVLFLVFTVFIIAPAFAGSVVIVNSSNSVSEISAKDLKNIYRLKKTNWGGGSAIRPVNLKSGNNVRAEFSQKILGKSPKEMESYYLKRALSGKGQPPKTVETEQDVIKYVSSEKGAIGYVSQGDSSVKTISVK